MMTNIFLSVFGILLSISLIGEIPAQMTTPIAMIAKENTEDVSDQSGDETIQFEQMAGRWRIDFSATSPRFWGSGMKYGDEIEISETGEFSYYIGITNGGTGQCEDNNGEITVEIEPYERHSSEKEILILKYVNDNGEEHIIMNWKSSWCEDIYWKRESILEK